VAKRCSTLRREKCLLQSFGQDLHGRYHISIDEMTNTKISFKGVKCEDDGFNQFGVRFVGILL
jgi:hypothetical protein